MKIEKEIAKLVKEKGGRTFYVGGYVRDKLLHIENKDVDIEVHGISEDDLYAILESLGKPLAYGNSFGVYSISGYNIDIALPRSEKLIGKKHTDFKIEVDPFIGYKNASKRRDITINALMEDVLSGEILDYYNGVNDLNNKVIRYVDKDTFIEDPLRVLRVSQFAARLDFKVDEDTINLCKTIDLSYLSKERVEEELKKALLKASKPSIFFDVLKDTNQLTYWFKEVEDLIDVKQDPIFHPEGDVYIHTMQVIDRCASYRDKVNDAYSFILLGLTHDFGKTITSEVINGRIHAYNHEIEGLPLVETFLKRITNRKDVIKYVTNMVSMHVEPHKKAKDKSSVKSTNKMFYNAINPKELVYFSLCDNGNDNNLDFLNERYKIYEETISKPYVTGEDLIKAGIPQGKELGDLLEYSTKLRLANVDKEAALKQTLAYFRSLKKDKKYE